MDERTFTPMPVEVDFIVKWIFNFNNNYPFVGGLFILMAFDFLIGLCAAIITEKVSSSVSYRGMLKKVVMLLAVGVGSVMEPYSNGIALSKMIAICFMFTELISITENMARAGVPMPQKVLDVLESIKSASKKSSEPSVVQQVTQIEKAGKVDIHTDKSGTSTNLGSSTDSAVIRSVKGEKGDKGDRGEKGEKGDKDDSKKGLTPATPGGGK